MIWAAPLVLPVRRKLGSLVAMIFDRHYSVETSGRLTRCWLRASVRHAGSHTDFMSVPLRTFYRAMRCVPVVVDTLTFVEFGCAKGRSLLLAAMWPYRRVIGIEHTPELATLAERNIRAFRGPRIFGDLRVVRADPVKFHLPLDLRVLFFFGTLEVPPALSAVLANAKNMRSSKRQPVYAVYIAERHIGIPEDAFSAAGFSKLRGPTISRFDPGIREHSLIFSVFESRAE